MECNRWREAISAQLDGEPLPVTSEEIANHIAECAACRSWREHAEVLNRAFRVQPAQPVPDFTEQILAAAPGRRVPHKRAWTVRSTRIALAVVAVVQTILGVLELAGVPLPGAADHHHLDGEQAHSFSEGSSWGLAVGIGLLFAAWRTANARGLLPLVAAFSVVVVGLTTKDLIAGEIGFAHVADHSILIAGLILLFAVSRHDKHSGSPTPSAHHPTSIDDWPETTEDHPLATPASGARSHRHLRPASKKRVA